MALVNSLIENHKLKHRIQKPTKCYYYLVFEGDSKFLQLETTGSTDRKLTGKVSQSIQFSPEAIKQLKDLLAKEF